MTDPQIITRVRRALAALDAEIAECRKAGEGSEVADLCGDVSEMVEAMQSSCDYYERALTEADDERRAYERSPMGIAQTRWDERRGIAA